MKILFLNLNILVDIRYDFYCLLACSSKIRNLKQNKEIKIFSRFLVVFFQT